MTEQDLKRKLLVERNEIEVPKKAVFQAIVAGRKKAEGPYKKRKPSLRLLWVLALVTLFTSVGFATGYAQEIIAKFPQVFDFFEDSAIHPENKNQAQTFIMEPGVGYVAGKLSEEAQKPTKEVKIQPGFYDVKILEGEAANLMGNVLLKGQTYTNYILNEDNYAEVTGQNVQLQMTPAKLTKEKMEDGTYVFKNRFGSFQIGKQIEPGDYQVSVETSSANYQVEVITSNNVTKGETAGTKNETFGNVFSQKYPGSQKIHLAEGSLLQIFANNSTDSEELEGPRDVIVYLKPLGENEN